MYISEESLERNIKYKWQLAFLKKKIVYIIENFVLIFFQITKKYERYDPKSVENGVYLSKIWTWNI